MGYRQQEMIEREPVQTRLLTEIRATRSQVSRHGERLRRLESLAPIDSDKSAELSE
jgi:hypothetical protein